jgi:hypothetical protein
MSQRNRNKTMSKKKGENEGQLKKQFDKRRKENKALRQKKRKGAEKNFDRRH